MSLTLPLVPPVPEPPNLYLVLTTSSTIQVNWLSGSNGGSSIQGQTTPRALIFFMCLYNICTKFNTCIRLST